MAEKELNSLISEYLTSMGYLKTAQSFKTETATQSTPQSLGSIHPEFLEAFEGGERQVFFMLWHEHIPLGIQSEDTLCQHLECSLSAYFAVYPLRTGIGNREQAMSEFRSYLDSRGSAISAHQDLAAYFALPYIPDPSKHPSFQNLFLQSWTDELRARLVQFLEKVLPRPSSCPALVSMYLNSKKLSGAVLQEDCIQKVGEAQIAYHTLCSIAMELVGALESIVAGEQVSPSFISGICSRLFESQGRINSITKPERPSTGTLRASIMSLRQSVETPNLIQDYPPLDFEKVKRTLEGGSPPDQRVLVQALRWRLTRSLPGPPRDAILASYITNDLLGCSRGCDQDYTSVILTLMKSPDSALCEQLARLFNTFSSLASGRSYLSEATPIILALLELLYKEKNEDTAIRRNALGAIQKLSLRRSVSRLMIKHSVVGWIVEKVLGELPSLSDYTLRYSLALLMNISLRAIGRSSCVGHGQALLEALGGMLQHKETEISEYVNGTLYSLFSSPQLQLLARQMGMAELLEEALQRCPAQRKTQLQYIIHQLNQEIEDEGGAMDDSGDEFQEDDEDDEPDPDMIEGDEGEVILRSEIPRGEILLMKNYLLEKTSRSQASLHSQEQDARKIAGSSGFQTPVYSQEQDAMKPPNPSTSPQHTHSTNSLLQSHTDKMLPFHPLPSSRPVTPQSFRSHTSSGTRPHSPAYPPSRKIISAS